MGFSLGDFTSAFKDTFDSALDFVGGGGVGAADFIFPGITAAGSLAGGYMANEASAKEASKNRDWQKMMSDTAHRREVADLRAAGLNPILSGTGGSGATSAPSGSTAQQHDIVSPAISSALQTMNAMANAQKTLVDAYNEKNYRPANMGNQSGMYFAQANSAAGEYKRNMSQAALNEITGKQIEELTKLATQNISNEKVREKILGQDLEVARAEALAAKNRGEIEGGPAGLILQILDRIVALTDLRAMVTGRKSTVVHTKK